MWRVVALATTVVLVVAVVGSDASIVEFHLIQELIRNEEICRLKYIRDEIVREGRHDEDLLIKLIKDSTEHCKNMPTGKPAEDRPRDISGVKRSCHDHWQAGVLNSSKQVIHPVPEGASVEVWCDMDPQHKRGWTTVLLRESNSHWEDFSVPFSAYKEGFGDVDKEYWIGLEGLHHLTAENDQEVKVVVRDGMGDERWAEWQVFVVGDIESGYALHVGGYNNASTLGDALTPLNGAPFTAHNVDRDTWDESNCAANLRGGFWYKECGGAQVTCPFDPEGLAGVASWRPWEPRKDFKTRFGRLKMMITPWV